MSLVSQAEEEAGPRRPRGLQSSHPSARFPPQATFPQEANPQPSLLRLLFLQSSFQLCRDTSETVKGPSGKERVRSEKKGTGHGNQVSENVFCIIPPEVVRDGLGVSQNPIVTAPLPSTSGEADTKARRPTNKVRPDCCQSSPRITSPPSRKKHVSGDANGWADSRQENLRKEESDGPSTQQPLHH